MARHLSGKIILGIMHQPVPFQLSQPIRADQLIQQNRKGVLLRTLMSSRSAIDGNGHAVVCDARSRCWHGQFSTSPEHGSHPNAVCCWRSVVQQQGRGEHSSARWR